MSECLWKNYLESFRRQSILLPQEQKWKVPGLMSRKRERTRKLSRIQGKHWAGSHIDWIPRGWLELRVASTETAFQLNPTSDHYFLLAPAGIEETSLIVTNPSVSIPQQLSTFWDMAGSLAIYLMWDTPTLQCPKEIEVPREVIYLTKGKF
jgi:hypothetical protein